MKIGNQNLEFRFGNVSGLFALLCSVLLLTACTDYEGMIDEDYEEWSKQQTFDPSNLPSTAIVGSYTDPRDGQTYRTAIIGNQTWMAQNLNYKTSNSICNVEKDADCKMYGRYYTWAAAKTACPSGWRLPSYDDWVYWLNEVGGASVAATKLKAKSVWPRGENGEDTYGFSALPAGYSHEGEYFKEGHSAVFWSSTDSGTSFVRSVKMEYDYKKAEMSSDLKNYSLSVRCIYP